MSTSEVKTWYCALLDIGRYFPVTVEKVTAKNVWIPEPKLHPSMGTRKAAREGTFRFYTDSEEEAIRRIILRQQEHVERAARYLERIGMIGSEAKKKLDRLQEGSWS